MLSCDSWQENMVSLRLQKLPQPFLKKLNIRRILQIIGYTVVYYTMNPIIISCLNGSKVISSTCAI
jgi:hypothetical protein